jgi:shikimate dehydrogenase
MNVARPIRGSTRVTGILGWPVDHSVSPAMHNAAYRALGLDFVYVPLPVRPEDLALAVGGMRALHVAGANVTLPHKVAIVPLLDAVSREAELIGAVNTVVRGPNGRLVGHNTDAPAFLEVLREEMGLDPKGLRAVVLGAGGAARAVTVGLALAGALSVLVANRTPRAADTLALELSERVRGAAFDWAPLESESLSASFATADLLVNCTTVGMRGDAFQPALPLSRLPSHAAVVDVVYRAGGTALEHAARAHHRTAGGLGMLVRQGALSQEMWTGVRPPVEVMAEAARAALG